MEILQNLLKERLGLLALIVFISQNAVAQYGVTSRQIASISEMITFTSESDTVLHYFVKTRSGKLRLLTKQQFQDSLRASKLLNGTFDWGFGNSVEDALENSEWMAQNLSVPITTITFSFPSEGRVSLGAYKHDRQESRSAQRFFGELLETLSEMEGEEHFLFAHSLGSENSIVELAAHSKVFQKAIFVAPDLLSKEANHFTDMKVDSVVVYTNPTDLALKAAPLVAGGGKREGASLRQSDTGENVKVINTFKEFNILFAHRYWKHPKVVASISAFIQPERTKVGSVTG